MNKNMFRKVQLFLEQTKNILESHSHANVSEAVEERFYVLLTCLPFVYWVGLMSVSKAGCLNDEKATKQLSRDKPV